MKTYRVRIVLEESEEVAGEYSQHKNYTYASASSSRFNNVENLYKALTNVGFYWDVY